MKYILKQLKTSEETICDKVTIDGFDYYFINQLPKVGDTVYNCKSKEIYKITIKEEVVNYEFPIICCTNPNIDIPKVVDEVERLAHKDNPLQKLDGEFLRASFKRGYNKAKETHPFSAEDADAYADAVMSGCLLRAKEWKEQQPIKVYYVD